MKPLFIIEHGGNIVGYFQGDSGGDGVCKRLINGEWSAPYAHWWIGRWSRICVGPIEMHAGRWEFDDAATEQYEIAIGRMIVA